MEGLRFALVILRPRGPIAGLDTSAGMEARFFSFSVRSVFTELRCSVFQITVTKLTRNKDNPLRKSHITLHAVRRMDILKHICICLQIVMIVLRNTFTATSVAIKLHFAGLKRPELETDQSSPFKIKIKNVWSCGLLS